MKPLYHSRSLQFSPTFYSRCFMVSVFTFRLFLHLDLIFAYRAYRGPHSMALYLHICKQLIVHLRAGLSLDFMASVNLYVNTTLSGRIQLLSNPWNQLVLQLCCLSKLFLAILGLLHCRLNFSIVHLAGSFPQNTHGNFG